MKRLTLTLIILSSFIFAKDTRLEKAIDSCEAYNNMRHTRIVVM